MIRCVDTFFRSLLTFLVTASPALKAPSMQPLKRSAASVPAKWTRSNDVPHILKK